MAGYWSRSALGDLAGVASRLLAQLAQPIGEEAREQINQSIRTGVREAIAPPRLANYDGYLLVDIIEADSPRSSDISGPRSRVLRQPTSVITGEAVAHLSFGTRYLLVVSFTTAVPTAGGREDAPIVKPVHIKDGIDQPTVPFRLYVDFGSVRIPIAERELAVPRTGESQAANFEFTPPAPARSPDVQTPSETTETRSPTAATQPLSIAIYQHGTFCEICHVPQEIETGSSSDQAAVTDPSPLAQ
jgi:hypothetical protein